MSAEATVTPRKRGRKAPATPATEPTPTPAVAPEPTPDLVGALAGKPTPPAGFVQPKVVDPTGKTKRFCTYVGHAGDRMLPATEEFWPIRKSGDKAGGFIGWCKDCQKLSAKRNKAEPERQGTRAGGSTARIQLAPARKAVYSDAIRVYSAERGGDHDAA